MGNKVISYSLMEIKVFLKVSVIMIRFCENNVLGTIYINSRCGWGAGYMVHLTLFCLLFIKILKLQEYDLY